MILDEKCIIKFWVVFGRKTLKALKTKGFRVSLLGSNPPLPTTKRTYQRVCPFCVMYVVLQRAPYYRWFARGATILSVSRKNVKIVNGLSQTLYNLLFTNNVKHGIIFIAIHWLLVKIIKEYYGREMYLGGNYSNYYWSTHPYCKYFCVLFIDAEYLFNN